jgi:hypothetical protein
LSKLFLWVYHFDVKSTDAALVQVNFSLYPKDLKRVNRLVDDLRKEGVAVRRGTVLRGLIELTSATDMFAAAMLQHVEYESKTGARESEYQTSFAAVDLPQRLIDKLEGVIEVLAVKDIVANRSSIVRAIVRTAPAATQLVPAFKQYLVENPRKVRSDKAHRK